MESMITHRWTINSRGLTLKKKSNCAGLLLNGLHCPYGKELYPKYTQNDGTGGRIWARLLGMHKSILNLELPETISGGKQKKKKGGGGIFEIVNFSSFFEI